MDNSIYKVCEVCGQKKHISEFSKSYPRRCKACVAEHTKMVRERAKQEQKRSENTEKRSEMQKKEIDWEARRYELVKISLNGYLPLIDKFTSELRIANTCVAIADHIIAKMKGNEE